MLNDVLDASKLESGKLELKKSPFNLLEQVNSVAEVFSVLAAQQGVKLKLKVADGIPEFIEGDAVRLSQVLINLVSNAIKFSDGKDVQLVLQAQLESDPQSEQERRYSIRVDVVDQGIGISAADQQKLFQPFSQANASTTREFGGSGLGLSICKGIMLQMGGEIWVESEESRGSTFSISFPALGVDPLDSPDSEPTASGATNSNGAAKPLRILVAEDNEVNRQVVEAFLNRLGYSADFVENGRLAVESALANQYDLILMDCQMPILDGFDAAAEIIQRLGESRPRIVALTAITQTSELERCLEVGMDEMISKPLRMAKLEAILSNASLCGSTARKAERV